MCSRGGKEGGRGGLEGVSGWGWAPPGWLWAPPCRGLCGFQLLQSLLRQRASGLGLSIHLERVRAGWEDPAPVRGSTHGTPGSTHVKPPQGEALQRVLGCSLDPQCPSAQTPMMASPRPQPAPSTVPHGHTGAGGAQDPSERWESAAGTGGGVPSVPGAGDRLEGLWGASSGSLPRACSRSVALVWGRCLAPPWDPMAGGAQCGTARWGPHGDTCGGVSLPILLSS
uniref:Uncharacterized protein n=1 Tax=Anas zonorhyncha TaxID=75864 RepID=A0A8B9ZSQ1_9AVES